MADRRPHTIYAAKRGSRIVYIGQTLNFRKRVGEHKQSSPWGRDVYFAVLEEVWGSEEATARERELIARHDPEYNDQFSTTRVHQPTTVVGRSEDLLTAQQVAGLIGKSYSTVMRHARKGHLVAAGRERSPGAPWLFAPSDVAAFVARFGAVAA